MHKQMILPKDLACEKILLRKPAAVMGGVSSTMDMKSTRDERSVKKGTWISKRSLHTHI